MDSFFYVFYQVAMILSLLSSAFMFTVVLPWGRSPGARAMLALSAATFTWALGFFLESHSNTLSRQLFFNNFGYIGSMSVPVTWFFFSLRYTGRHKLVTVWSVIPFCVIPVVTVILVWTNPLHHLMWYNERLVATGNFLATAKDYGPFFWIALTYNYVLILTGAVILISRLFIGAPLYARQAIALLIAVSLPLVWNIIYVFQLLDLPRKDLTPAMFAFSGLAIVLGVMRFRLLAAAPFAREFVIHQLHDGVLILDLHHRLTEANPAALALLKADHQIIGKELAQLQIPPVMLKVLSTPQPGVKEIQMPSGDGDLYYELETIALLHHRQPPVGWIIIIRDVSDRKRLQQQLIVKDRLTAIGGLTSGIAHEINNPLTSVIGFSELLLNRDLPADIRSDLMIVNNRAVKVSEIVNNLLTFVHGNPDTKSLTNINDVVQKTLDIRSFEQNRNGISTVVRLASDLPLVQANEYQIGQVFLNIVTNAEFFMAEAHGRGTLTVVTNKVNDAVRIAFSDDGPGISEEQIQRIFDPFFTTKEIGQGTGLGLSICHGIVTEHRGKIWAESEIGKGTRIFVELPEYTGFASTGL